MKEARDVLVTGGTGYLGRKLSEVLVRRGHRVRVLARLQSLDRVPAGAEAVAGDVLDRESVARALRSSDVLVHLVGTPHPGPGKAVEFRRVDLASIKASVAAASRVGVAHFIYVSVAQPAPVMKAYIEVRAEGERLISEARLAATVLRPWYVLGPGHWWPVLLLPVYALAAIIPSLKDDSRRLGLVTLGQMATALVTTVEGNPPPGPARIIDVPGIRAARAF